MNNPEVTDQALNILRSGENFHWSFITLLVLVIYVCVRGHTRVDIERKLLRGPLGAEISESGRSFAGIPPGVGTQKSESASCRSGCRMYAGVWHRGTP